MAVTIAGFTDETGASDYNLRLSQRRAAAVGRYLGSLGISVRLMTEDGRGEVAGSTDKAANRRVEVLVRLRD